MSNVKPFSLNIYPNDSVDIDIIIKVLPEEYLEEFLKGNLHMNPYQYFRSIEEKKARGDDLEGIDCSFRSETSKLYIADTKGNYVPINGVIGRINFNSSNQKNINLFSCSGFLLQKPATEDRFFLDSQFLEFGDKAVVICNVSKFLTQVKRAFAKRHKLVQIPNEPCWFRHVDYVSTEYNGRVGAFRKLNEYEWQQELRIGVLRNYKLKEPKAIKLRIGSVRGYSQVYNTEYLVTHGLTYFSKNIQINE